MMRQPRPGDVADRRRVDPPMTDDATPTLASRLREHVEALAGGVGVRNVRRPHALAAAARYIGERWASQGHVVRPQRYRAAGVECENLEIAIGGEAARPIVLIGAHYDTVDGSPGADDNASGIAALLEIGALLAGARLRRTLKLVAFVNEEPPFFPWGDMGSHVYARAARLRGERIRVMLSLEMLGCYSDRPRSQTYPPLLRWFYPDRGNFVGFVSNLKSWRELRATVGAFRAHCDFPCESLAAPWFVPGVGWSDHLSFWREGYPGVMVTDTAFHRYPHYHAPSDTPERLDYASMARVVGGLAAMAVDLAGRDGPSHA
jgi:Zn-dependent M28 family amino/carboxypeptidase